MRSGSAAQEPEPGCAEAHKNRVNRGDSDSHLSPAKVERVPLEDTKVSEGGQRSGKQNTDQNAERILGDPDLAGVIDG